MSDLATTATVLLYSDDRTVREDVRLALGRVLAADLPPIDVVEVATQPAVLTAMDAGGIDLVILDAEATPSGGMGIAHQLKDEIADCPPVLLLIARVADAWLATWSKAEAVVAYPVDPVRLPTAAAELLRARLSIPAE
jgi:DNA-binding response OmpR family regulator